MQITLDIEVLRKEYDRISALTSSGSDGLNMKPKKQ